MRTAWRKQDQVPWVWDMQPSDARPGPSLALQLQNLKAIGQDLRAAAQGPFARVLTGPGSSLVQGPREHQTRLLSTLRLRRLPGEVPLLHPCEPGRPVALRSPCRVCTALLPHTPPPCRCGPKPHPRPSGSGPRCLPRQPLLPPKATTPFWPWALSHLGPARLVWGVLPTGGALPSPVYSLARGCVAWLLLPSPEEGPGAPQTAGPALREADCWGGTAGTRRQKGPA